MYHRGRVYISRHVKFVEDEFPFKKSVSKSVQAAESP